MRLDRVTAELRPRETWEASDFGARLVRRDAGKIYFLWFAITLPLLALALLGTWLTPWYTAIVFVYWWLEPLADGPILHIIARRLFGEDISGKDALRAAPRLAWQNRLFWLTPYRLHAARSVAMPVTQLEGLRGGARRKRSAVINNHAFRHGFGLTIVYQHVVIAIYLGIVILGYSFIPEEYRDTAGSEWFSLFDASAGPLSASLSLIYFYVAQSALQPWFIGAGFGLYINCRTRLEAWDLEVAFRRMAERRNSVGTGGRRFAAVVAVLAVCMSFGGGDFAIAQTPAGQSADDHASETVIVVEDPGFPGFWSDDELRQAIETVAADPRLDPYREVERWVAIEQDDELDTTADTGPSPLWDVFRAIGKFIAVLVEYGLWIGLAAVLVFLFAVRARWLPYLRSGPRGKPHRRRVLLAGGEVTEESLPEDVPGEVRRLWNTGRKRDALSLLYRGTVFAAVRRHGVRLPASATEGDCVMAVAGQCSEQQSDFFRRTAGIWLRFAYGARDPDNKLVLELCDEWPSIYAEQE